MSEITKCRKCDEIPTVDWESESIGVDTGFTRRDVVSIECQCGKFDLNHFSFLEFEEWMDSLQRLKRSAIQAWEHMNSAIPTQDYMNYIKPLPTMEIRQV